MTTEAPEEPLTKRDLLSRLVPPQLSNENEKALSEMEALLRDEEFDPGIKIITQGGLGDKMYFISEGEVEIINRGLFGLGKPQTLATLKAGHLFGEMALVLNQPRSADVVAITPVKTFSLSNGDWQYMKAFHPRFAGSIEDIATRRAGLTR